MNKRTLLSLPPLSLNLLSGGFAVFLILLGLKVFKSSEIALEVANSRLVTGNSANKLQEVARQLDEQAQVIKQKEEAYQELHETYEQALSRVRGFEKVKKSIRTIEELPEVENIEAIQTEISITEDNLEKVGTE